MTNEEYVDAIYEKVLLALPEGVKIEDTCHRQIHDGILLQWVVDLPTSQCLQIQDKLLQLVIEADLDAPNFSCDVISGKKRRRPFGVLAREYCNVNLELKVLRSAAGWYIGTADEDGPCSRESHGYFETKQQAEFALDTGEWTQRDTP